MKKVIYNILPLVFVTLLFGCQSSLQQAEHSVSSSCQLGQVKVETNFATGRMGVCEKKAENLFAVTLTPENTPINSSPWYAFKVSAQQATEIQIQVSVEGDKHRYPPKISVDGKQWKLLPYQLRGEEMVIKLQATSTPVFIAAQEIIDNQYYVSWANGLTKKMSLEHQKFGQSVQGRPIYKLEYKNHESNEWLVVLGRLHPPEVTGALALFPFVETLLESHDLATKFRARYNILVIPNLNPDGVFAGNWRHNANGLDLNRDWIKHSQPEVKQVHDYLQQLVAQGHKVKFAVDFHSTHEDVFYTMPSDYGVESPLFVEHWLADLDAAMPNFNVVIKPGNKPNNGVSKQYFADNYGVHAVTYEMGDNTDRQKIKDIADNAATTLMKRMLELK